MARNKSKKIVKNIKKNRHGTNDLSSYNAKFQQAYTAGQFDQALEYAEQMVSQFPTEIKGWVAKADLHARQKQFSKAINSLQSARNSVAKFSTVEQLRLAQYQVLGGQAVEALPALVALSQENNESADIFMWLSHAYHVIGQNALALEANDKSLAISNENVEALLWRSRILDNLRRHTDAKETLLKIKKISPKAKSVSNHLGSLSIREGNYDLAEKYFNDELQLQDNSIVFSSKIISKHYNPNCSAIELKMLHEEWAEKYQLDRMDLRNKCRKSSKKIRVGMLSGGFRIHPVGQMIVSALKKLPENEVELYLYSTNQIKDFLTAEIQKCAVSWKVVESMTHLQLSDLIAQDEIDILIDMNGGGDGSRYQAISRKPAPVIVKWVGMLINTTGIEAVDYLLSDHFETPENYDHLYTEKLIRLPDDYICYSMPGYIPNCNALPALSNQYITFGCLNNPAKLSAGLIKEWSQLLIEIPDSKLLLKGIQFEGDEFCKKIIQKFKKFGVEDSRLILEGPAQHVEFLKAYHRIDIALDTWPYSGGLTTCEALAMGVPVVTHVGPTFAGRHSATHLANAGLPELVTDNWDDFRKRAKELASDLPSLAVIRAALRTILTESPVCDGERFAKHFAKAMRAIWQRHCEGRAPEALIFNKEGDAWFADEDRPIELVEVEAEPEPQEAEFEWNLESPITVIDNGALFARHPKFTEWMQTGNFAVITFDPGSLLTKQADELKKFGEWQHYPHATLGDGKNAVLYVTIDPLLTGTLKPEEAKKVEKAVHPNEILSELPISTVALREVEGLPQLDVLTLNSANSIKNILDNLGWSLDSLLVIEVSINLNCLYEKQDDIGFLIKWGERNGFELLGCFNRYKDSCFFESEKGKSEEFFLKLLFVPCLERIGRLNFSLINKLEYYLKIVCGLDDAAKQLMLRYESLKKESQIDSLVDGGCAVDQVDMPDDDTISKELDFLLNGK